MRQKFRNIGLIIFIAVLFIACNNNDKQLKQDHTIYVKTQKVVTGEFPFTVHTSGSLSSKSEQKLSFKTGGIIDKMFADEGQQVKNGDVLAILKLSEINARAKQAKLGMEKAKRDFERVKNLYNDSVATLEQYQDMETALKYAGSNVKIANFNLTHSKIVAPTNGKILKKIAEENEMVGSGHPVFLFGTYVNNWIVRVNVIDKDLVLINIGDSASVSFDAFSGKTFRGIVSEIGSLADPYTGTYEVEIKIADPDKKFASGFIAKIDIVSKETRQYYMVPVNALIEGSEDKAYVYELVNGKPVKTIVTIDHFNENYLFVTDGIKAGTEVIIDGGKYITKSSIIKIKN